MHAWYSQGAEEGTGNWNYSYELPRGCWEQKQVLSKSNQCKYLTGGL